MVTETVAAARAVEYRVERLPILDHPEAHLAEILDRLNDFGKQGWRVVSIDLTHHPSTKVAAEPATPLPFDQGCRGAGHPAARAPRAADRLDAAGRVPGRAHAVPGPPGRAHR